MSPIKVPNYSYKNRSHTTRLSLKFSTVWLWEKVHLVKTECEGNCDSIFAAASGHSLRVIMAISFSLSARYWLPLISASQPSISFFFPSFSLLLLSALLLQRTDGAMCENHIRPLTLISSPWPDEMDNWLLVQFCSRGILRGALHLSWKAVSHLFMTPISMKGRRSAEKQWCHAAPRWLGLPAVMTH